MSKPEAGRVLGFPHVFMAVEPEDMVAEADRLQSFLAALGCEGWTVETTYRPEDGRGILALFDLRSEP